MKGLTRTRWAAIGAAVAVTLGGGGLIGVSASGEADSSALVPITPVRILDTRQIGKVVDETYLLQVTGDVRVYSAGASTATVVPTSASAVAMTLTVTEGIRKGSFGFVTAFPCASAGDTVPNASTINFVEGTDVANSVAVPLGSGGAICLNVYGSAHLIVDISGYYSDGRLDDIEGDIASNASDIASNASGIASNAGDIALNSSGIASNAVAIDAKADQSEVDRLASNRRPSFVETPVAVAGSSGALGLAIEQGANGLPVMTRISSGGVLNVTTCDDVGCADDGEVSSALDVGEVTDADLAIGTDGFPVVVYRTATPELGLVACTSYDCATHRAPVILDDRAGTGETPDIAVGVGGAPVIAYTVGDPGAVALIVCDDRYCEGDGDDYIDVWAHPSGLDSRDPSVAIDPQGKPVIAFQDRSVSAPLEDALRIYGCSTSDCRGEGSTNSIYSGVGGSDVLTGYHPSLTFGASGHLLVVFGELDLAQDPDVWTVEAFLLDGIGAAPQEVAEVSGPVSSTAVRINSDGKPFVAFAFEDAGAHVANFVQCFSASCSTTIATLDAFTDLGCGSEGCGVSLAMVGGGVPVMAYQDATTASPSATVLVPWWTVGGR
ncbi:MAG: hypothetical protein ACO38K_03455 [Ilumatobacteraceae bacterium]